MTTEQLIKEQVHFYLVRSSIMDGDEYTTILKQIASSAREEAFDYLLRKLPESICSVDNDKKALRRWKDERRMDLFVEKVKDGSHERKDLDF